MPALSPSETALSTDQLGNRLRNARREAQLTLREVGEELGVTAGQVSKYETGRDNVPLPRLTRLAGMLGVPVESLLLPPGRGSVPFEPVDLEAGAAELARLLRTIQRPAVKEAVLRLLETLAEQEPSGAAHPPGLREAQAPLAPPPLAAPPRASPAAAPAPALNGLANQLREAMLTRGSGLTLRYQPVVHAETAALVGFEALLRWTTPDGVEVPPLRAVALAEQSGLAETLDFWVLQEAAQRTAQWAAKQPNLVVAINVTSALLTSTLAVSAVRALLRAHGLRPGNLCIEVTETVLLDQQATSNLKALRKLGLKLAIDDFGTGQSALTRLMDLDVDVVKLDRGFFAGRQRGRQEVSFLEAMVRMAHARGARVVAEGIACREDAALALRVGCDACQGFWYAEAISTASAASMVGTRVADLPWRAADAPSRR